MKPLNHCALLTCFAHSFGWNSFVQRCYLPFISVWCFQFCDRTTVGSNPQIPNISTSFFLYISSTLSLCVVFPFPEQTWGHHNETHANFNSPSAVMATVICHTGARNLLHQRLAARCNKQQRQQPKNKYVNREHVFVCHSYTR